MWTLQGGLLQALCKDCFNMLFDYITSYHWHWFQTVHGKGHQARINSGQVVFWYIQALHQTISTNYGVMIASIKLWVWRGPLVERMCRITKRQLAVPGISAQDLWKLQPWPVVFTFTSRGQGWLEQITFVQSWLTGPAGVASMLRAMRRWSEIPIKRVPYTPFTATAADSFDQVEHSDLLDCQLCCK